MDEPLEAEGEVKGPAPGAHTWPFVQHSSAKSINTSGASISREHQSAKSINQSRASIRRWRACKSKGPAAGPRDWLIKASKRCVRASPTAFVSPSSPSVSPAHRSTSAHRAQQVAQKRKQSRNTHKTTQHRRPGWHMRGGRNSTAPIACLNSPACV